MEEWLKKEPNADGRNQKLMKTRGIRTRNGGRVVVNHAKVVAALTKEGVHGGQIWSTRSTLGVTGFMYEPSIPINLSWVREVYANKTKKDQRKIFLRGRKITCSVSTNEKTLGIPKFRGKCRYSKISEAYNNKTLNMDEVLQVMVRKDPHGGRIHVTQLYQLGQRRRF
ncbi:hypothetical protein PIB30_079433 [Stylosanthes scabra]|uniref:HNH homing endonuclease n=1 Tax=Stylosanthes scabra TaxID=79078 RepID=A0ABU6RRF3_9FABA|nr:hypothetical protein [Stylosanthes scabra]